MYIHIKEKINRIQDLWGDFPSYNLNLGMLVFEEREKPEYQSEKKKPLRAEKKTNNKLNPHMTPDWGIESRTHWWETSTLTTAPSLLPNKKISDV